MNSNYTIIRCNTTNKELVMDVLCDALEYKLVQDHVDAVYYNGNNKSEKKETRTLISNNLLKLNRNGISADSKPDYLNNWYFIQLH